MAKTMISHHYCDESMARSKGVIGNKDTNLEKCRKNCASCIACIEIDTIGNKEHVRLTEQ